MQNSLRQNSLRNVAIIGTGSAGLTAAIYAGRANLSPLVVEGIQAGGQLTLTTEVENFPGFPQGVQGPQLMQDMRAQAERFGAEFLQGDVSDVDLSQRPFRITVEGETVIDARSVIVATGASANLLGLPSESKLMGHGVSTCATCDGYFFRGQEVAVVGGGDSAVEEAIFLTKFATKVTVIHRRDKLRASKILQDRAFTNDRITFCWNSLVEDILGDAVVTGIRIRQAKTGATDELSVAGVFIAIGHSPNTALVATQLETDIRGYIVTRHGASTSVPGVFAAGDVQDSRYRQAITAAGFGCMAAMDAERFLEGEG